MALVVSVQGTFRIPKDTPDGVYGVTMNDDGSASHINKRDGSSFVTPKMGLEPSDISQKYALNKRADGAKCVKSGAVLVRNDISQAQYALADACDASADEFISAGGNRYSKFGNAVVYVCNYGVKTQHCFSSELNADLKEVENLCGDVAGNSSSISHLFEPFADLHQATTAVTAPGRRRMVSRMWIMGSAEGRAVCCGGYQDHYGVDHCSLATMIQFNGQYLFFNFASCFSLRVGTHLHASWLRRASGVV